jgi:hypothetical protein
MSFKPYTIYGAKLPVLKVGHLIRAGDKMYQVSVVRPNRQKFTETGVIAEKALNTTTDEKYQALHGSLEVFRIVNIQYLAFGTATDTIPYWQKEPIGSKWVKIAFNSTLAGLDAPLEVNRWSYDKELRMSITIEGVGQSQDLYFDIVEYEVVEYTKALTKGQLYLKIFPNGQARMMQVD